MDSDGTAPALAIAADLGIGEHSTMDLTWDRVPLLVALVAVVLVIAWMWRRIGRFVVHRRMRRFAEEEGFTLDRDAKRLHAEVHQLWGDRSTRDTSWYGLHGLSESRSFEAFQCSHTEESHGPDPSSRDVKSFALAIRAGCTLPTILPDGSDSASCSFRSVVDAHAVEGCRFFTVGDRLLVTSRDCGTVRPARIKALLRTGLTFVDVLEQAAARDRAFEDRRRRRIDPGV